MKNPQDPLRWRLNPHSRVTQYRGRMFDHYILTPFNVRVINTGVPPTEEWLSHRLRLFERYCLPSVQAQDSEALEWVFFIDVSSPDFLRDYLRSITGIRSRILEIDGVLNSHHLAEVDLKGSGNRWVITTRLDNDDAISTDFCKRLYERLTFQHFTAYNFLHGLQATPAGLLSVRQNSNPFISLLEDRTQGEIDTVRSLQHSDFASRVPTIQIEGEPAWLQVIHSRNLGNRPAGFPVSARSFVNNFPPGTLPTSFNLFTYIKLARPFQAMLRRAKHRLRRLSHYES